MFECQARGVFSLQYIFSWKKEEGSQRLYGPCHGEEELTSGDSANKMVRDERVFFIPWSNWKLSRHHTFIKLQHTASWGFFFPLKNNRFRYLQIFPIYLVTKVSKEAQGEFCLGYGSHAVSLINTCANRIQMGLLSFTNQRSSPVLQIPHCKLCRGVYIIMLKVSLEECYEEGNIGYSPATFSKYYLCMHVWFTYKKLYIIYASWWNKYMLMKPSAQSPVCGSLESAMGVLPFKLISLQSLAATLVFLLPSFSPLTFSSLFSDQNPPALLISAFTS